MQDYSRHARGSAYNINQFIQIGDPRPSYFMCRNIPSLVILLATLLVTSANSAATRACASDEQIEQLVAQLNHSSYEVRQNASRQIAELGFAAVPALVEQVIAGKPESAVRSAKILEQIGLIGDEDSVIRIARLYLLLAEQGHRQFAAQARLLSKRWKKLRVKTTVKQLEEARATVTSLGVNDGMGFDLFVLENADTQRPNLAAASIETQHLAKPRKPRESREQILEQVSKIMAASDDESRHSLTEEIARIAVATPIAQPTPANQIVVVDRGGGLAVLHTGQPVNDEMEQSFSVAIDDKFRGAEQDFSSLALLPNIQQLTVENTKLDAPIINLLKSTQSLQLLTLNGVEFELAELLAVMRSRPNLYVTTSGTAFLGVTAENQQDDGQAVCQISSVVPESAAHEAGLLSGDIIAKIDGVAIETFQQLVVAISVYSPGDEIEVEIGRLGETSKIRCQLKTRPLDLIR